MKALLQRVSEASVVVDGEAVGEIGVGILALVAVERDDTEKQIARMLERILNYRMFSDAEGRMNINVQEAGGSLLVVSQFTLAADTHKGNRASFLPAAPPEEGERLYNLFCELAQACPVPVAFGRFGADMKVSLTNDGPVTFLLEVS